MVNGKDHLPSAVRTLLASFVAVEFVAIQLRVAFLSVSAPLVLNLGGVTQPGGLAAGFESQNIAWLGPTGEVGAHIVARPVIANLVAMRGNVLTVESLAGANV